MNKKINNLKEKVLDTFIQIATGKEKNVKKNRNLKKEIARELTKMNMENNNG